jgi:hypothetical protein
VTAWCPLGACCLGCRSAADLGVVVSGSPSGPLCVTLCRSCRTSGPALRLTLDAVARLAAEHREHVAARAAEAASWTAGPGGTG